jgi:hypothetical protein
MQINKFSISFEDTSHFSYICNWTSASTVSTGRVSDSHFHHIFASGKDSVMTIEGEQVRLG